MKPSKASSLPTGEGIVIDIGTGDGLFVYQCARRNPNKFYIGIDANPRPLEKISEKLFRKPEKGGAPNALFLQAGIEELPSELDGVADEVHIHFPWGSLLQAVARGDEAVLGNIRRICSLGALLEIIFALDPERDQTELARLEIPPVNPAYINLELRPRFERSGFKIIELGTHEAGEWPELRTRWGKRLAGASRQMVYLIAQAESQD